MKAENVLEPCACFCDIAAQHIDVVQTTHTHATVGWFLRSIFKARPFVTWLEFLNIIIQFHRLTAWVGEANGVSLPFLRAGLDVPDFPPNKPPDYRAAPDAKGMDFIDGDSPFIMHSDGKGWLYVPNGLVDGPDITGVVRSRQ